MAHSVRDPRAGVVGRRGGDVTSPVHAVVFDLGGVLAEFGGVTRMRTLARVDSDDELWRRWLTCEWVRRFERGACPKEDFARGVVDDWALELTPDAFLAEFGQWLVGPLPGAQELVGEVRERVPVACLSNTNSIHWDAGAARWPLWTAFDRAFLSFEIGMVKPDREVFDHVAKELDSEPATLLFLDDNTINVEAALAAGFQARRAVGVDEARTVLRELALVA